MKVGWHLAVDKVIAIIINSLLFWGHPVDF